MFDLARSAFGLDGQGPLAASLLLCAALALGMFRYRNRYRRSLEERRNSLDLIENLSEGIYRSSLDGRQLHANPALVKLNGYDSETEMLAAVKDIAREWYVDPDRRSEFGRLLERDGKVTDFVSEIYRHKTRERIWISECARLVREEKTGRPLYYEGSVRDITETIRRLELEERHRKLADNVPGGLFQLVRKKDGSFAIPYASSGFWSTIGVPADDPRASPDGLLDCVKAEDRRDLIETLRRSEVRGLRWDCEFQTDEARLGKRWLRVTATPEKTQAGIVWHGYLNDISRRKSAEFAIRQLAFNDPLTDLPNRRMFLERMGAAVKRCARRSCHGALLLDLDNFKALNDTHGHDAGDAFLVEVGVRLRSSMRAEDLVARIGGDEFVVLIDEAGNDPGAAARAAMMMANRLLQTLRDEFRIGDTLHAASASIGIVLFDGSEESTDVILKKADLAMYRVKGAGRDGIALYDNRPTEEPPADRIPQPTAPVERSRLSA